SSFVAGRFCARLAANCARSPHLKLVASCARPYPGAWLCPHDTSHFLSHSPWASRSQLRAAKKTMAAASPLTASRARRARRAAQGLERERVRVRVRVPPATRRAVRLPIPREPRRERVRARARLARRRVTAQAAVVVLAQA